MAIRSPFALWINAGAVPCQDQMFLVMAGSTRFYIPGRLGIDVEPPPGNSSRRA